LKFKNFKKYTYIYRKNDTSIEYRPIFSGIGHYRYRPIPSPIPSDNSGTMPSKSMAWLACNV